MYCPKCSQQPVSDDVRYCARCGFPLGAVAALISNDGVPAALAAREESISFSRCGDARTGAKLIFFSVILLPVALALSFIFDAPGPLFIAVIPFFIGLMQMLYVRIFGESLLPERQKKQLASLDVSRNSQLNLPASQSTPVPTIDTKRANTSEMAVPPSVTENTTKLLDDNQ